MKLDIFNINEFIDANHCPKVTNATFFNFDTTPTSDGLFSYELFGLTDEERKNTFGYIDLNGKYIHPLVYNMISTRMGALKDVLNGSKYAVIADKKIKIVPNNFDGAETGIDFLYDNFDKINWLNEIEESEIDSIDKKTRLKFLKSITKEEFFVDKWLVLPPFYRSASSTNKSMGDAINKLYKELIAKTKSMNLGFSYDLFGAETKYRIQNLLKDIYLSTMSPVSGKNLILEKGKTSGTLVGSGKSSMIRKHLLGKTVDWTASCVITSPENSAAIKFESKPVPFGTSLFPLATLVSLFSPFFVSYIHQFLETILTDIVYGEKLSHKPKKIDLSQFTVERIETMIKKFIQVPSERFEPLKIEYKDESGKVIEESIIIYEFKTKEDALNDRNGIERELTMTDIFYISASVVLNDKHVYVTRYPVANFQNIYPARIKILSTSKTRNIYYKFLPGVSEMEIFYLEDYPMIYHPAISQSKIDTSFFDVMICGNAYIAALGGDYDGDMLYMKPVYSKEANAEAEKLIWAKSNFLNAGGVPSRSIAGISKDCILGLYALTKEV